jgi:molybdopterin synthase sulfur carrier subunit
LTGGACAPLCFHTLHLQIFYHSQGITMAIIVRIPTPLRTLTAGAESVPVDAKTVRELIENLETAHPGMKDRLMDEKGVRRFVNLYVGEEDIRFLDGLETALKDGDELSIVPAIAGGR